MKKKLGLFLTICIVSGIVFAAVKTTFYGIIDMQHNKIINLASPDDIYDAANKKYVVSNFFPRTGGNLYGKVNMHFHEIFNVADTNLSTSVPTREYVDSTFLRADGEAEMSGSLDMRGYNINYLATPTNATQAVNKFYVDNNFLYAPGGHVASQVDMGGYRIYNMANPVSSQDAATKTYVDASISRLAENGSAFQYFALRRGSSYPPLVNIGHPDNTNLTFVVIKQFYGKIYAYGEGINAAITNRDYTTIKTWKVGDPFQVAFSPPPYETTQTNGNIIVSCMSNNQILGRNNFGVSFTSSGPLPLCPIQVFFDGTPYSPNTAGDISSSVDHLNLRFGISKINGAPQTVTGLKLFVADPLKYDSDTFYPASINIDGITYSVGEEIVLSDLVGSSAVINVLITIPTYDAASGLRLNFYIKVGSTQYNFGQFFAPGNL